MKYELKQAIYSTARICCGWLGTRDITLLPVTLTVCYTAYLAQNPTKCRAVTWWQKSSTALDPQHKVHLTLQKLNSWLSLQALTFPWLAAGRATWSYHLLQSNSLQNLPQNGKKYYIYSITELFWSLNRKLLMFECFLWQPNRCIIPKQPPQMTFSYYTPKALSSTVWFLACSCCNCRVPSCSSYLPSNSISQIHLKTDLHS